jgi:phage shock protein PspC (stress-responsive transcriptional regulator)
MNPNIELAQLSLMGRRYSEAEEKFTQLLSTPDAPHAWLGLGLAKIGNLPAGKSTPDEVAFCFKKVFDLTPDGKEQACLLALSAAKAMLGEVVAILPKLVEVEDAATRARGAALFHKGFAYLRGSGVLSRGSGPTLFTNLDALHDSYRGSILMDASSEMSSDASKMRKHLAEVVNNIQVAVKKVVPKEFPGREDFMSAGHDLWSQLILGTEMYEKVKRITAIPATTRELYQQPYRSSDQKSLYGVCGGLAHRWGWRHSSVQLVFVLTGMCWGIGVVWYIVELNRAKNTVPTKGVPMLQRSVPQ